MLKYLKLEGPAGFLSSFVHLSSARQKAASSQALAGKKGLFLSLASLSLCAVGEPGGAGGGQIPGPRGRRGSEAREPLRCEAGPECVSEKNEPKAGTQELTLHLEQ